jgi:hypothetical protein
LLRQTPVDDSFSSEAKLDANVRIPPTPFELLIVLVLIGLIPAAIAQRKGESFVVWWIYGALLFIMALPHALLKKPNVQAEPAWNGYLLTVACACGVVFRREGPSCL